MEETNQNTNSTNAGSQAVMPATPVSIVPPSSANPTIPPSKTSESDKSSHLPKKAVTLESVESGQKAVDSGQRAVDSGQDKKELEVSSNESAPPNRVQRDAPNPAPQTQASASEKDKEAPQSSTDKKEELPAPKDHSPESGQMTGASQTDDEETDEDVELPDLTPEQVTFLNSERYIESGRMLNRQYALNDDDLSFLAEMDHAVLSGVINLEQYIGALRDEFPKLNDKEKDEVIGILIAYRFLPFGTDLRPDAGGAASKAGIHLPSVPYYRIYTRPLTYSGAAHEVARMAGIEFMGQAQDRLRDIIISRMKGVRTDLQVEEQLRRTPEQGGMGLPEDRARMAREAMVELFGRAKLVSEEEFSTWLNKRIHHRTDETKKETASTSTPLEADEEKEIEHIQKRMPKPAREMSTILSVAVESILRQLSWHPKDEYLDRRLANMISTRLRDVRSKNEIFMKLLRDAKVGGMGLKRGDAEKLLKEIEDGYNEFRDQVAKEEREKIRQEMIEQERKIEERKRQEAEEHARWYEERVKGGGKSSSNTTAKKGGPLDVLKQMRDAARGGVSNAQPPHPIDLKEKAKERQMLGELVSIASKKGIAPAKKMDKVTTMPSKAPTSPSESTAPRITPPKPQVKVSAETVRLKQKSEAKPRKQMTDIVPPISKPESSRPGLSGPLEEISQLTLDRFRRLGQSTAESVQRIQDLVQLLGEESYEKRIMGIQAWKKSPMQKQYLDLVSEAFMKKTPLQDLLKQKKDAGEPVPSQEELNAIIQLNGALKL